MRILMLSWEYPPHLIGGMGAHVADLVPALAAQGVEVVLVTPAWKGGAECERIAENAVVHRVTPPVAHPSNYFADAQQTNLTLENYVHHLWDELGGFDLIHAHDWLVSFASEALKKLHKTPMVATIHATERGRGRGQLYGNMAQAINGAEWWLTYEAWRVIATSRFMANEVESYFQLPFDKIAVIPNGVTPSRFQRLGDEKLAEARNEWASPHERIVFYIGRVQHEKGVHLLIDAAQALAESNVRLILAGTGSMLNYLRQHVEAAGLSDHVFLPGYISDETRDQLFQLADVAVFPSLYEPFGIVALEAMAARCPVIVSDVGGLGEVVENQITGLKVPPDNAVALAQAIQRMLSDRTQARQMAERAYDVVCREYSWSYIARATIELYQDIVNARNGTAWT